MSDDLPIKDFSTAEGVKNWRVISDGSTAFFPAETLADAAKLVDAISAFDGIEAHRPWLDIRDNGVTVRFLTRRATVGGRG